MCLISELNIFVTLNTSDQNKLKHGQLSFQHGSLIPGNVCDGGSIVRAFCENLLGETQDTATSFEPSGLKEIRKSLLPSIAGI